MTNNNRDDPAKEALTNAADLVKYTLALGTGALVFSVGLVSKEVTLTVLAKGTLTAAWTILAVSITAGIIALMVIPGKIASKQYHLADSRLTQPYQISQVAFVLGVIFLGLTLLITLWCSVSAPAAAPS
jgi:hypothetical protein